MKFSVVDARRKKQGVRTASPLIPSAFAGALVAGNQLGARRNRAGFCGTPFSRTSKCRCGPVERPVEPDRRHPLAAHDEVAFLHDTCDACA